MTSSLQLIKDSFLQGGGGIHFAGLKLVIGNVVLTLLVVSGLAQLGSWIPQWDSIDVALEAGNVLLHFSIFSFIAFIPLKTWIKHSLLFGLLLTQSGLLVDLLGELMQFESLVWHRFGNLLYFFGGLFVAYGATHWVVFTYRMSTLDKLTRVHNRRFFEAMVDKHLQREQDKPADSCLLSMDMDDFKDINDRFGHAMGDIVLQIAGRILLDNARKEDVICRSGGEEFEVLLTGVSPQEAQEVAKRILALLRQHTPEGIPPLTASIGIANACRDDSTDSLRRRADYAMYKAKKRGKAQVAAEFIVCN